MDLIKTHAPLHTPADIRLFGSPSNFDSGPLELMHKENCKKPTKLCKSFILDKAKSMHSRPKDMNSISTANKVIGGLKLRLKVSPN